MSERTWGFNSPLAHHESQVDWPADRRRHVVANSLLTVAKARPATRATTGQSLGLAEGVDESGGDPAVLAGANGLVQSISSCDTGTIMPTRRRWPTSIRTVSSSVTRRPPAWNQTARTSGLWPPLSWRHR